MASRRRFKPDPDFQMAISRAVIGGGLERRIPAGGVNRRAKTLKFVGDEIIKEAKRLVDGEDRGLPSTGPNGQTVAGYDFAKEVGRRTYRSSFRTEIRRELGRLILVVINSHPHAQEVEFGNDEAGEFIYAKKGSHVAIPITMAKYKEMTAKDKKRVQTPRQLQQNRDRAALKHWTMRRDDLKKKKASRARAVRRLVSGAAKNPRTSREQLLLQGRVIARQRAKAEAQVSALTANVRAFNASRKEQNSFPAIAPNGKPYLYARRFRTYRGYAILQRAMRKVTLRELE